MATTERIDESAAIEQPADVQHHQMDDFRYGGIGRRAVGIIIDGIVLMIANFALGMIFGGILGGATSTGFSLTGGPAFLLMGLSLLIGFGYFIYLEGTYGTTPGKRLVGLKVVMEDGTPCSISAAAVRNVLRVVDGIFFYLVGAIFIGISDKKQRLGDRVADTLVVRR